MRNDIFRKGLVLGILLLFVTASIVSALNTNPYSTSTSAKSGNWLYVGGSGPENYSTIQSAINNASSGDTIFVFNGIYYENIILNKDSINLTGENKEKTIIDGMNTPDTDTFFGYFNYLTRYKREIPKL